jgi:hypothetical protein
MGTLPGRKPGKRTFFAASANFLSTAESTSSAGTPTVNLRSKPDVVSTETRILVS